MSPYIKSHNTDEIKNPDDFESTGLEYTVQINGIRVSITVDESGRTRFSIYSIAGSSFLSFGPSEKFFQFCEDVHKWMSDDEESE